MLTEIVVVAVVTIASMFVGAFVANILTDWRWGVPLTQIMFGGVIGYCITVLTGLHIAIVPTIIVLPLLINLSFLVYTAHQHQKAISGGYGEEVQWAAELFEEGDEMFIMAANQLPQSELRDIGIIADSKEHLRELTIERLEETDEEVSEDFIQ